MGDLAGGKRTSTANGQRARPSPAPAAGLAKHQANRAELRNILDESRWQPKLSVGAPTDVHEQEADTVAARVAADQSTGTVTTRVPSRPASAAGATAAPQASSQPSLQAEESDADHEETPAAQLQRQRAVSGAADDDPAVPAPTTHKALVQAKAEPPGGTKGLKYITDVENPDGQPREEVQAKALTGAQATSAAGQEEPLEATLAGTKGGGSALPGPVREQMESRFSADFSSVRVHTGSGATAMNARLHAAAFTHGNDIYFNEGRFDPGSTAGRQLLAHELTHTIQQGASRQRDGARVPVKRKTEQTAAPKIQRNWLGDAWDAVSDAAGAVVDYVAEGLDAALNYVKGLFTDFVKRIPGYKLLAVILGRDPISGETVEQNGLNFIEAGLDIIPFGDLFKRKLEETGKLQEAANWLDTQIKTLEGISLSSILSSLADFWSSLSLSDLGSPEAVLERAANIIRTPIARIVTFCGNVASYFLKLIKDFLLRELSDFVAGQQRSRAFPLLCVILGKNPITDEEVERNGMNLIRGFVLLSADGEEQLRQMEESGSLQRAAQWIDTSVARLGLAWEGIKNAFSNAWALITIENLVTSPIATFREIVEQFVSPVMIIIDFIAEVASMILKFIKDALLGRLSAYARNTRGYPLLTVILGSDPFTGAPVERTPENLIHGFMALMDGGEEQFQQMKESGAIARMTERIERAVATLNFTWDYITGLFASAWESLSLRDLAAPIDAFIRIVRIFADPIVRLFDFVVEVVKIAIEVVLRVMQFPFNLISNIIAKATQAFNDIKRDPIGFLKNLLRAVKTGFSQFFDNFATHLLNGVTSWLFKELGDAGITPPTDLSLRSILGFVLDVLGVSLNHVFDRLALKIGQERVAQIRALGERLTGAWTFISDVMERGPVAIWEYVQEKLNNLWNIVLDAVSNWVVTRVVQQITARLLSMLDPTGIMAVVNGFIAFFRAVQSFIAYLREMLEIVNSFVEGVAEIAAGSVASAANFLEGALARAMPVAIGFLANQVGLSGLGRRIGEMIETVREKVDEGIDWLIDKALSAGTSIMNMVRGGGSGAQQQGAGQASNPRLDGMSVETILAMSPSAEPRDAAQKQRDVDDAAHLIMRIGAEKDDAADIAERFQAIKTRFGLREIGFKDVGKDSGRIEVSINPKASISGDQLGKGGTLEWTGVLQNATLTNDVSFSGAVPLGGTNKMVASKMEAKMLGPNHPMGSATGNNSIPDVMGVLTSGSGASDDGYIAGHLLNYDLGGPGNDARNLFPITGYANNRHYHEVEKTVKEWVNDKHYWVTYTVEVSQVSSTITNAVTTNCVNADFVCEAHPKKLDGKNATGGFRKTIQSRHGARPGAVNGATTQTGHGAAQSDTAFTGTAETVPRADRGGPTRRRINVSSPSVTRADLMQLDGIGPARADQILANQPIRNHAQLERLLGKSVWDRARDTETVWPIINNE